MSGAAAAPSNTSAARAKRIENLKFELAFGGQGDAAKNVTFQKHAAGARDQGEKSEMFVAYVESLTPEGRVAVEKFLTAGATAERAKRIENLKFELAFGGRTDDAKLAAHHKHVAGAKDDAERHEMFAATYASLTWDGKGRVTRFLGGQKPVQVPEFNAAVKRQFAGRSVPEYEVTMPPDGSAPKGVILSVHGGAWVMVGPGVLHAMDGDVNRWNSRGWAVVNVDYRAGAGSVDDVVDFYDAIREWKPDAKVGATGQSAGGHLSMMVAAKRPDLNFVISQAGPSDLTHVDEGTAQSRELQSTVNRIWDANGRVANSPALNAGRMGAKILAATAVADELVPVQQGERMRAARPDLVQRMDLERGNDFGFIHGMTSQRAMDQFYAAEVATAARS